MKPFDNKDFPENEPIPISHPTTHRFFSWVQEKKTAILIILSVLLALFLIILSFVWNVREKKLEEIKTARMLVSELNKELLLENQGQQERTSDNRADTLKKLTTIVQQDPELQKELSGFIAQEMIIDREENLSPWTTLAADTLSTLYAPQYADFSKISGVTSEHKIEEAYKAASQLRLELEKNNKAGAISHPSLYSYTLLQIASCAKFLNQKEKKEEALGALKNFIHESLEGSKIPATQDAIKKITAHFQENGESLTEFIEQLQ